MENYIMAIFDFFPKKQALANNRMKLEGQCAVVIGGVGGVGAPLVALLLTKGAKVVAGFVNETKVAAVQSQLADRFGADNFVYQKCDIRSRQDVRNLFKTCREKFHSGATTLCNNAGIVQEYDSQLCIDVNFTGAVAATEVAFEEMGQSGGGSGGVVVHCSSIAGYYHLVGIPLYSATKAGLTAYCRAIGSKEHLGRTGVRVNCVTPCGLRTDLLERFTWEYMYKFPDRDRGLHLGMLSPEPVAEAMVKLIEDDVSGQVFEVSARGQAFVDFDMPKLRE